MLTASKIKKHKNCRSSSSKSTTKEIDALNASKTCHAQGQIARAKNQQGTVSQNCGRIRFILCHGM
jgi:hypothetical protein